METTTKKQITTTKNEIIDKVVFYTITLIYGSLICYGGYIVLSNISEVSFNF